MPTEAIEIWRIDRVKHRFIYDLLPHVSPEDELVLRSIAFKIGEEGCRVLNEAIDRYAEAQIRETIAKCSENKRGKK